MKEKWQMTTIMVLLALIVGYLAGKAFVRPAEAQMNGEAGNVTILIGPVDNGDIPVMLLDSLAQALVIYEYDLSSNRLELKNARTYRYDKALARWGIGDMRPSVRDTRQRVQKLQEQEDRGR
ncbi:MAG: hypothetical protein ACLFWL_12000 [Candidatus Brocadiia bacterium]